VDPFCKAGAKRRLATRAPVEFYCPVSQGFIEYRASEPSSWNIGRGRELRNRSADVPFRHSERTASGFKDRPQR
jgi:hypothetical protein